MGDGDANGLCTGPRFGRFGDDGELRTEVIPAVVDEYGCEPAYPRVLTGTPDDLGHDARCVCGGIDYIGCDYRQALEATLKALTPSTSPIRFFDGTTGHGDTSNAGFLRPDAHLAVLVISAGDDCSTADPTIFARDYDTATPISPFLRCQAYADHLHPIARYVDGLLALRPPERTHFAILAGVPTDLVTSAPDYDAILGDPRMIEPEPRPWADYPDDSYFPPFLCDIEAVGINPAPRLVEFARDLSRRGATVTLGSLCAPLDPVVDSFAKTIKNSLAARCE